MLLQIKSLRNDMDAHIRDSKPFQQMQQLMQKKSNEVGHMTCWPYLHSQPTARSVAVCACEAVNRAHPVFVARCRWLSCARSWASTSPRACPALTKC